MERKFRLKDKMWKMLVVSTDSPKLIKDGEKCCGQIFFKKREIYIDEEMMEDKISFDETITHELTHATCFSYAIDEESMRNNEESLCEFMAVYGKQITRLSDSLLEYFYKCD